MNANLKFHKPIKRSFDGRSKNLYMQDEVGSTTTGSTRSFIGMRSKYEFKQRTFKDQGIIYKGKIDNCPDEFKHLIPEDAKEQGYKFCEITESGG